MCSGVCGHKSLVMGFAAVLLSGSANIGHAQEAPDLRLDTQDPEEEVATPPPPPDFAKITIGDDEPLVLRKKSRTTADPYAAQGVKVGAFRMFPTLEIGGLATSNVSRDSSEAKSDIGLRLKSGLGFESDWVRHQLTGSATAEVLEYLDNNDLSTGNAAAQAALRLDIRRSTRADIDARYTLTSTGAEDSEVPDSATGARVDHVLASSGAITHDFGGIEGRLRLGVAYNGFGDVKLSGGGTENNEDRNYTELSASLRTGLKTGGLLQPFAEVAYEPRFHDKKLDRNGIARDSHGLRVSAGVAINDDPVWTGEIAATYTLRDYEDATLETASAPGISARLTWQPTDLTSFEFNAGASLSETVTAGSSATRSWNGGMTMTHALRENIDLIGGSTFTIDDTSSGTDVTATGRLAIDWQLNPLMSWSAAYEATLFDAAAANGDYTDHRILTSIILKR